MAFAIPFTNGFKYLQDQTIQFNINYKRQIKKLDNFIKKYQAHRINFRGQFTDSDDLAIMKILVEQYPESKLVLAITGDFNLHTQKILNQAGLPHYYQHRVNTWDIFHYFLSLNVTDIIIDGEIAFSAKNASDFAKEKDISLRCFCNSANTASKENIKHFFIRPEDIQLYEDYIDTFEFDPKYYESINTIYEIYAIKQKWQGKLMEIIANYYGEEDNRCVYPIFGQRRLNCGWKCLSNGSCNVCKYVSDLSHSLREQLVAIF